MRTSLMLLATLTTLAAGCHGQDETATESRKLFLDVHDVGPGKLSAEEVAAAHAQDLATETNYEVDFEAYFFDQENGKIYCLAEAASAERLNAVHEQAHGLLASSILEVTADTSS